MNRCKRCGAFDSWEALEEISTLELVDIFHVEQRDYFIHRDGSGCRVPAMREPALALEAPE
jgi:hypothetical protein